jgi:copper ion binding protein
MNTTTPTFTGTTTFTGSTTFRVEGMTCDHCRAAVTSEVGAVPGVQAVTVDIEAGTVTVSADQPVEQSDIAAAVDEAGYALLP